jgi:hypothetical protein
MHIHIPEYNHKHALENVFFLLPRERERERGYEGEID